MFWLNIYSEYNSIIIDSTIATCASFFRYAIKIGILQNNKIWVFVSILPYFKHKYNEENKATFNKILLYFSHFISL